MDGNMMGYEEFFSCYDLKHAYRTNSTTNNSLQFAILYQSTSSSTIGLHIMDQSTNCLPNMRTGLWTGY